MLKEITVAILLLGLFRQGFSQNLCNARTRFRCRDGLCLSKAKVCNGNRECAHGEDEENCLNANAPEYSVCRTRQERMAERNMYYPVRGCRKPCEVDANCKGSKRCICDDECGLSCVNPFATCESEPPEVENSLRYTVYRRLEIRGTRIRETSAPYSYGAFVEYACRSGYRLEGPAPRCNGRKKWSGEVPTCVVTYPRFPPLGRGMSPVRGINANDIHQKHEIYLLFDISSSVLKKIEDLENEIAFAKRLVRRMESFKGSIQYGIMVFASANVIALDVNTGQRTPDEVIGILDDVYNNAASEKYLDQTRSGTATANALNNLMRQIHFMYYHDSPDNRRHVFIFTDGLHTEGPNPIQVRTRIETMFAPTVEFYSVTACISCDRKAANALLGLSSGQDGENYIFIEDFYQMSTYLDKVTNVTLDFAECGQAGDVGSIKQQASLGRSVGGEDSAENAWPWQALITEKSISIKKTLARKELLLGGASIISKRWILTAAHVLKKKVEEDHEEWKNFYAIFVGIFERPRLENEVVKNSVKAYAIENYFEHPDYNSLSMDNDIALIQLGAELDYNMNPIQGTDKGLAYGYYIRPVCLPCTGTCLKREHLVDGNRRLLITNDMTDEEKCQVEERILLFTGAKAVVTGFGHVDRSNDNRYVRHNVFNPARKLQQALLQLQSREQCETGVEIIKQLARGRVPNLQYTKNMMCFRSGLSDTVVDACKGDNGGPVVREVTSSIGEGENKVTKSCWVQVGIVSFGFGCGTDDLPGYYTNVAKYITWINATTNGMLSGY